MSYLFEITSISSRHVEFLEEIRIDLKRSIINLHLHVYRRNVSKFKIEYRQYGSDTCIVCEAKNKEIVVKGSDFVSVFCDDLKSFLLHTNTRLRLFDFENEERNKEEKEDEYRIEYLNPIRKRIYQGLADTLKHRNQKLQVKELYLNITEDNQITSILPYIDPSTMALFKLRLNTHNSIGMNLRTCATILCLADMWASDFWILAKPYMDIFVDTLQPETLIELKKALFINSNIDDVGITYDKLHWTLIDCLRGEELPILNSDNEFLKIIHVVGLVHFNHIKPYRSCSSTNKRLIDEVLQELSIRPKEGCDVDESLKNKHALNLYVKKVFGNDILLKKIVEYVDNQDIQRLRKVSRDIRQHIDGIKLDTPFKIWCFAMGFSGVLIPFEYHFPLQYIKMGDGCIVEHYRFYQRKYIAEDYRTRCLKDFEICMKHWQKGLETLHFQSSHCLLSRFEKIENLSLTRKSTTPFLRSFKKFFTSRTRLKVKKLELRLIRKRTSALQQNDLVKVLPFLDPQILEIIDFDMQYYNTGDNQNRMIVDEISNLSQWMNAKELIMTNCIISTPIQEMNITHFVKGDITVQTITSKGLRHLKEGFQNNSSLVKFKIAFKECTFKEFRNGYIYKFMGIPHIEANPLLRNQRNTWFYRMPNCDNILHIVHFVGHCITFARVEPSQIPEIAWIYD